MQNFIEITIVTLEQDIERLYAARIDLVDDYGVVRNGRSIEFNESFATQSALIKTLTYYKSKLASREAASHVT